MTPLNASSRQVACPLCEGSGFVLDDSADEEAAFDAELYEVDYWLTYGQDEDEDA